MKDLPLWAGYDFGGSGLTITITEGPQTNTIYWRDRGESDDDFRRRIEVDQMRYMDVINIQGNSDKLVEFAEHLYKIASGKNPLFNPYLYAYQSEQLAYQKRVRTWVQRFVSHAFYKVLDQSKVGVLDYMDLVLNKPTEDHRHIKGIEANLATMTMIDDSQAGLVWLDQECRKFDLEFHTGQANADVNAWKPVEKGVPDPK